MKKILLIVALLLTFVAIWLTARWLQPLQPILVVGEDEMDLPQATAAETVRFPLPWSPIREDRALLVVQENLFHPDRLYELKEEEPEEVAPDPTEVDAEQFELVGIVRVRDRAVASIIVHPKAAPDAPAPGRRPVRRPGGEQPKKTNDNRGIYKEGDPVGESGYTLTRIDTASIILTKGEGEDAPTLEIPLDMADDNSKARMEDANELEQGKLAEQAAERERLAAEQVDTQAEQNEAAEQPDDTAAQSANQEAGEQPEAEGSERPSPREILRRRLERERGVTGDRVRRAIRGRDGNSDETAQEDAPVPQPPTDSETTNDTSNQRSTPVPPGLPQ